MTDFLNTLCYFFIYIVFGRNRSEFNKIFFIFCEIRQERGRFSSGILVFFRRGSVLCTYFTVLCIVFFPTESCFRFALTSQMPPLFCRQGYLKKQGIVGNRQLWQHARDAGLMPDLQDSEVLREKPQVPQYFSHTGAAVTSAMSFDGL